MHIIFLGPPGSGKGTQAAELCKQKTLAHISTGDMLRAEIKQDSDLGKQVQTLLNKGELVDDETIIRLIEQRVKQPDCRSGFILDGVPRTLQQAQAIEQAGIPIHHIVEFHCPTDVLINRLTSRWVHPASGRIYNLVFNPPQQEGKDDITGEPLIQRNDDNLATVQTRIQDYKDKTEPVCHYYQQLAQQQPSVKYHRLDASLPSQQVTKALLDAINS